MKMKNSNEPCCAGDFPTVGPTPLNFVGSGKPQKASKYTMSTPKGTLGRGSSPTGSSGIRGSSLIHNADGPKCHIVATLYKPNASEASMTQKRTYTVPSKAGTGDFYMERARQGQSY